jgi:hypothetical protein
MKKILLAISLVLSSFNFIGTPAHADENQATYAVVNSAGVVTNIIVCGPAVCGPNGSWGGIMPSDTPWAGQQLVLQVPVHTETGKSLGGYLGTPENPVKYDSQAQVFTQGSASTPEPVTRSENIDNVTLSATIQSEVKTFGPNSVVNNQMQFTPLVNSSTGATLSAIQQTGETRTVTSSIGVVTTEYVTSKEMAFFDTPKTRSQIQTSIENRLRIIQQYLNRFYVLLNGWIID